MQRRRWTAELVDGDARARDLGVWLLDAAAPYGDGAGERLLGAAFQTLSLLADDACARRFVFSS